MSCRSPSAPDRVERVLRCGRNLDALRLHDGGVIAQRDEVIAAVDGDEARTVSMDSPAAASQVARVSATLALPLARRSTGSETSFGTSSTCPIASPTSRRQTSTTGVPPP
jgi:hypothetical protein